MIEGIRVTRFDAKIGLDRQDKCDYSQSLVWSCPVVFVERLVGLRFA
jgi:hypothetical protein